MSGYIKGVLATQGWQEIEVMFNDTLKECSNLDTLPRNESNEIVAREARIKADVYTKINSLLKRIKLAGKDEEVKKPKSFK